MSDTYSDVPGPAESMGEPPKKKKTIWIIVAVVAVLLICCCVLVIGGGMLGLLPVFMEEFIDDFVFRLVPLAAMI